MYKALVAREFKNDDAIVVENLLLEELRRNLDDNNFIVKIHASPINPLDNNKLLGVMFTVKCPFTPGSEASGVIAESKRKDLVGKKVTLSVSNGAWREYAIAREEQVIFLNDDADLDIAACGFVNPLTCIGLLYQAQKYNAKGIVNLAAQSALGKMINNLAKERGLNCLNVIRGNEARVKEIQQEYLNENVISLEQDTLQFQKQFKEKAEQLQTTVAFDPIGGAVTGLIFNNLPQNSTLIVYGSLSGKDIEGINGVQVRWANKRLEGFMLFAWFESILEADRQLSKILVRERLNTLFKPNIDSVFPISEPKDALKKFRSLNGGKKVIFRMNN